jgi:hypothetical protein
MSYNDIPAVGDWSPMKVQALTYLVALGSKAIVISSRFIASGCHHKPDKSPQSNENVSGNVGGHILKIIKNENESRLHSEKEKRIKIFDLKISSQIGVQAVKRGRNNELRSINLRAKRKPDLGLILCWVSKKYVQHHFTLDDAVSVVILPSCSASGASDPSKSVNSEVKVTGEVCKSHHTHKINISVNKRKLDSHYVRLTNSSRHIDIKFEHHQDCLHFIDWIYKFVPNTSTPSAY